MKLLRQFTKFASVFLLIMIVAGQSTHAQSNVYQQLQWPFYDPDSVLPIGTGVCTPTTLSGSDNEEMVWNYFVSQGLSGPQTAGIMGNMMQESHFDPLIMENGGKSEDPYDAGEKGWGIIQWSGNDGPRSTGDKVTSLYKASGLTGPIYELATQLDLVWGHMQNKPPITSGDFSIVDFKKITDEVEATEYFRFHIEGGTDPDGIRGKNSREILQKYGGSVVTDPSTSAGDCSNSFTNGECSVNKPVYKAQYSEAQLAQIYGAPGTADSHPELKLVTASFLGHETQVHPLVAPCLEGASQQIRAQNIKYKVRQFGCYRYDSDNGSSNIGLRSYHTYGAACDLNWDTNPWSGDGSARPYDMPQEYIQAFHDHGFTWGGDWDSVKDYMHFEWHGVVPN